MGFSNYFIFYFIRRFLNIIFNRKRLKKFAFIIICAIIIWFILHSKGYCDFTYVDSGNLSSVNSYVQSIYSSVNYTNTYLSSIYTNTNTMNSNLSNININTSNVATKLDLLYSQAQLDYQELQDIESYLSTIDSTDTSILNSVLTLQSDIADLKAMLEIQLPQIQTILNTINGTIQSESDDIQDTITQGFSDTQELLTRYMFGEDYDDNTYNLKSFSNSYIIPNGVGVLNYDSNNQSYIVNYYFELPQTKDSHNFKLSIDSSSDTTNSRRVSVGFSNSLFNENGSCDVTYRTFITNSGKTYSFNSSSYGTYKYLVITALTSIDMIEFTGDYNPIMDKGSTQSIMDNQTENAEMIDNTITDSSVNAPFGDLPSDFTQDITESGFTNIFDTIRTTFTSGVARDLVVPIPFTGKSFTINTANVYGNANFGLVGTLITAFWYFAFSLFIAKDIAKKINMIKSGNLENIQSTNIKEDLL